MLTLIIVRSLDLSIVPEPSRRGAWIPRPPNRLVGCAGRHLIMALKQLGDVVARAARDSSRECVKGWRKLRASRFARCAPASENPSVANLRRSRKSAFHAKLAGYKDRERKDERAGRTRIGFSPGTQTDKNKGFFQRGGVYRNGMLSAECGLTHIDAKTWFLCDHRCTDRALNIKEKTDSAG